MHVALLKQIPEQLF